MYKGRFFLAGAPFSSSFLDTSVPRYPLQEIGITSLRNDYFWLTQALGGAMLCPGFAPIPCC